MRTGPHSLEKSLTRVIAVQTQRTTQLRGAMEYILHTKNDCTSDVTDHPVSHGLMIDCGGRTQAIIYWHSGEGDWWIDNVHWINES